VLESLSFQHQNLRQAVLGLGVMLMFFLFGAIFILELNRMRFMPIGHVGSKMKHLTEDEKDENAPEINTDVVVGTAVRSAKPTNVSGSFVEISLKNDKVSP